MKLNKNIEKVYKYSFRKNTIFDNFFVRTLFVYLFKLYILY
ncbi:alpha-L-Rha alpha-1,3-L-rhamnosyltransferase [Pseudoleptotrichia goodfellowii]|uniref:Alpha-L-Rha alpha-1,3-L-rhamnosyltransferase n=1 Tax=Pseudoleptotrichia goodfellowii TaxID=157692 RepID=A0A510JBZ1_9FUSO|nr:alpha-L-Rha alpha-1,3-L-rhamnosyltransferase [Pseudoleptotrichia goodfellowii]